MCSSSPIASQHCLMGRVHWSLSQCELLGHVVSILLQHQHQWYICKQLKQTWMFLDGYSIAPVSNTKAVDAMQLARHAFSSVCSQIIDRSGSLF